MKGLTTTWFSAMLAEVLTSLVKSLYISRPYIKMQNQDGEK
jgi:hypothetical protein